MEGAITYDKIMSIFAIIGAVLTIWRSHKANVAERGRMHDAHTKDVREITEFRTQIKMRMDAVEADIKDLKQHKTETHRDLYAALEALRGDLNKNYNNIMGEIARSEKAIDDCIHTQINDLKDTINKEHNRMEDRESALRDRVSRLEGTK